MKKNVLLIALVALSCNAAQKEEISETRYVFKENISEYELSETNKVARIEVGIHNPGNDTVIGYRAQLNYNNETYIDTLKYVLRKGDTVSGELIFSQLPYHKDLEKSLQSEMVAY